MADDLKSLVMARMNGSADLLARVGNVNNIHPNAHVAMDSKMPVPSVWATDFTIAPTDEIVANVEMSIYVYDNPGGLFFEINRIIEILTTLFVGWRPGMTKQGLIDEFAWDLTSSEFDDDNLNKDTKFVRFRAWLVA